MTTPSIRVRRAESDDFETIERLLENNDLPSRDVRTAPADFVVAVSDGECVGAGGLERYGTDGLLRSVVVERSRRGEGVGTIVCDELERNARENGVETVYLLTTTAAGFFRRRGFEVVDREAAPSSIRETSEFADLCPASATCMRKHL